MKINTSQISMDASAEHKDVTGKFTKMEAEKRGSTPEFQLNLPGVMGGRRERTEENRQSQQCNASSQVQGACEEKQYETSVDSAMEQMVTEVVGQRVRLRRIQGLENGGGVFLSEPLNPPGQQTNFTFQSVQSSYHYEKVSVQSSGFVQLEDGREINFSLDLTMERESLVTESFAWRGAGAVLMDPLVFSFDCDLESLVNRSFQFDLNCDGKNNESYSLKPGSGFLALDLNNDGQISDGSELFGPGTGDGFGELAMHDLDGNGWIDENDPVFEKLMIWAPEENGGESLISLSQAGVGAICLTHDKKAFQLRDRDNTLMGEVAANGFFLTEDGEVRPLQEVKLALQGEAEEPETMISEQKSLEAQFFLQQMVGVRRTEVREMANFGVSRKAHKEERDLWETLFPDWQKERELASVLTRNEGTIKS